MEQDKRDEDYVKRRAEFEKLQADSKDPVTDTSAQSDRVREIVSQQLSRRDSAKAAESDKLELPQTTDSTDTPPEDMPATPLEHAKDPGILPHNLSMITDVDSIVDGNFNRILLHEGKIKVFDGNHTTVTLEVEEQVMDIAANSTKYIQAEVTLSYEYGTLTGAVLEGISLSDTFVQDDTISLDGSTTGSFTVYYDIGVVTSDTFGGQNAVSTIKHYSIGNGVLPVPGPATEQITVLTQVEAQNDSSGSESASYGGIKYKERKVNVIVPFITETAGELDWQDLEDSANNVIRFIHTPHDAALSNTGHMLHYDQSTGTGFMNWEDITDVETVNVLVDDITVGASSISIETSTISIPAIFTAPNSGSPNIDITLTDCS